MSLQARLSAKSASCSDKSMKLPSVSPELAAMRDTAIPMPGMVASGPEEPFELGAPQMASGSGNLTVASLGERIELLHTRTRPKKVTFKASDGSSHTFLLKVTLPTSSFQAQKGACKVDDRYLVNEGNLARSNTSFESSDGWILRISCQCNFESGRVGSLGILEQAKQLCDS